MCVFEERKRDISVLYFLPDYIQFKIQVFYYYTYRRNDQRVYLYWRRRMTGGVRKLQEFLLYSFLLPDICPVFYDTLRRARSTIPVLLVNITLLQLAMSNFMV